MSSYRKLVLCLASGSIVMLLAQQLPARTDKVDQTQAALFKLESSDSPAERSSAARTIAGLPDKFTAGTLQSMVNALNCECDPLVRSSIAGTIGEVASKQAHGLQSGQLEPAMVEALSDAFALEDSPQVRCSIAYAAGKINHPSAAKLLEKAMADPSSAVRTAAHSAKVKRDQRLIKLVTG